MFHQEQTLKTIDEFFSELKKQLKHIENQISLIKEYQLKLSKTAEMTGYSNPEDLESQLMIIHRKAGQLLEQSLQLSNVRRILQTKLTIEPILRKLQNLELDFESTLNAKLIELDRLLAKCNPETVALVVNTAKQLKMFNGQTRILNLFLAEQPGKALTTLLANTRDPKVRNDIIDAVCRINLFNSPAASRRNTFPATNNTTRLYQPSSTVVILPARLRGSENGSSDEQSEIKHPSPKGN